MIANNKNVTSILGKFALFLVGTLALFAVIYVGILVSNAVLQLLAEIFEYEQGGLANALFDACVGEKYATIPDSNAKWTLDALLRNEGVSSITEVSVNALLGDHREWAIFAGNEDWKNNGYIMAADFQYLLALIGAGVVLYELLIVSAHLAKRLFEIVFLYVTMPASVSTLPMDDGARFKNWRESFVTKVIIVYGAVIGVNIFVVCINSFSRMSLQNVGWFENALFYVVMIIGGAMMLSSSIELFAKVFGNGEDVNQARRLFAGIGHLAGHAAIAFGSRAIGAGKWGANKAYGSYHNTHGGAKASAKHDIATARYRAQLEAKAAAKAGTGGSAAQDSGASDAILGADGGAAATPTSDAGGGSGGGGSAQGGAPATQPSSSGVGDGGGEGMSPVGGGETAGGGTNAAQPVSSNNASAEAFGGATAAAVLLSGKSNGGNAAPAAAPAQSPAQSAGDAGNGGNVAQPIFTQNISTSSNSGGNAAASGPAGRDGRDGKDGARGQRGEKGLNGKEGTSAPQSSGNAAQNSGNEAHPSMASNAADTNNAPRSSAQHKNGEDTTKPTQDTAKQGEASVPLTPPDEGGNKA